MKAQEVYDKACTYLLSMKERSMGHAEGHEICMYRGSGGNKCVVGYFIPDEKYSKEMEGRNVCCEPVERALGELSVYNDLLSDLQSIHDNILNWDSDGFIACQSLLDLGRRKGLEPFCKGK